MATVQEWHLAIRLDPDLVSSMLGEERERRYVESEFAGLRELPCTLSVSSLQEDQVCEKVGQIIPKQVPKDSSLSLDIEVARFARESRTK
jgi:hypothetical protein